MKVNFKKSFIGKTVLSTALMFSFIMNPLMNINKIYAFDYTASPEMISIKNENYFKVDTSKVVEGNYNIYVNGNKVELEDKILVLNNNSFLPLRALANVIGAETYWDNVNKVAKIEFMGIDGPTFVELTPNCTKMFVDGVVEYSVSYLDDTIATFIEPDTNRLYLPVRAVSESLVGVLISYYSDTHTISITTDGTSTYDPSI